MSNVDFGVGTFQAEMGDCRKCGNPVLMFSLVAITNEGVSDVGSIQVCDGDCDAPA